MTFDVDRVRNSLPRRLDALDLTPGERQRTLLVGHERLNVVDFRTGENSFQSLATLAARTGMSVKSVARGDSNLVAAGISEKTGTVGRQRTSVYRFHDDGASSGPSVDGRTTLHEDDGASCGPSVEHDGASKHADGASKGADGASCGRATPTPTEGRGREEDSPGSAGSSSSEVDEFIRDLGTLVGLELDPTNEKLRGIVRDAIPAGWTPTATVDRRLRKLPDSSTIRNPSSFVAGRLKDLGPRPVAGMAETKTTAPKMSEAEATARRLVELDEVERERILSELDDRPRRLVSAYLRQFIAA